MKKYKIIYCYLDLQGRVEMDEELGEEIYRHKIVFGQTKAEALDNFMREDFKQMPEVVEIIEI